MRKVLCLLLLLIIGSGLIPAAGCGRKPVLDLSGYYEGKKKGETTSMNEEEFSAPIYPDAELDERITRSMEKMDEKGQVGMAVSAYWTSDPIAKVVEWYKKELSGEKDFNNMSSSADGSEVGMFSFTSGDRSINITVSTDKEDKEKVIIRIISSTGEPETDTE